MGIRPGLRLGGVIWLAGMVGVIVLTLTVVPQLLLKGPVPVPVWLILTASLVQSGVLLALAVWAGVALSRPLGLRAPVLQAIADRSGWWSAAKPQIVPGLIGGLVAGAMLVAAVNAAPAALREAGATLTIPLAARLLYGGITEEILMRWGLMTLLAWLGWRIVARGAGMPRPVHLWSAALVAALLFGIGHLPAISAMGIRLDPEVVTYAIVGNAVPGFLFGVLYARWGLESAFLAHALAHGVAVSAGAV